ncbi:hypothetical protein QEH56_08495 [Pelagicoccus enzymogenes]|uniref:hypothetical protein n=1 Tax=Pelagicoccus enzymogenes TaxID=2773457 RepID=UPI00280EB509|nr:hypothetical protein [Pelagicoccus enzymogenes]MDQ8198181.1 hypothetical protein [Pelagicoccus enzymogenes]
MNKRITITLSEATWEKVERLEKRWNCKHSEMFERLVKNFSSKSVILWDAAEPNSEALGECIKMMKTVEKALYMARYALERTQPFDEQELIDWRKSRRLVEMSAKIARFRLDQILNIANAGTCPVQMNALERLYQKAKAGKLTEDEVEKLFRFWSGKRYRNFNNNDGRDAN